MSELAAEPTIGSDAAPPDVPDASSAPAAPAAEPSQSDAADFTVSSNDYDDIFGLPPEEKPADVSPDVEKVADAPVARPDEAAKTDALADDADAPTEKDAPLAADGKLNWDDDKVPFREEYKKLKEDYMALRDNAAETKYISDPAEFAKWMKESSPTSYKEVGALITIESADNHPEHWAKYLADKNPDLLAAVVSGREGMTLDRLRAELEVVLDEDDEDVQAALEKNQASAKPAAVEEAPEQKRIREIIERDEQTQLQTIKSTVFQPIERAVEDLVRDAGLEINQSDYQGKNFHDLDADTQYKMMINEFIPFWVSYRIEHDPQLQSMQSRLEKFIGEKDIKSATSLQHPAKIAVSNFAAEVLSVLANIKAKATRSDTESPAKQPPQPIVKTAGASNGIPSQLKAGEPIDWSGAM